MEGAAVPKDWRTGTHSWNDTPAGHTEESFAALVELDREVSRLSHGLLVYS